MSPFVFCAGASAEQETLLNQLSAWTHRLHQAAKVRVFSCQKVLVDQDFQGQVSDKYVRGALDGGSLRSKLGKANMCGALVRYVVAQMWGRRDVGRPFMSSTLRLTPERNCVVGFWYPVVEHIHHERFDFCWLLEITNQRTYSEQAGMTVLSSNGSGSV